MTYEEIYEDIKGQLGELHMKVLNDLPVTPTDINKVFEEQSDFNMCMPPADDAIYMNHFGAVCMNVKTLDKLLKAYRGES